MKWVYRFILNSEFSISSLLELGAQHLPVVRVVVAVAEGSTPRETGAAMIVTPTQTLGTIGGGQLEFQAIARARILLRQDADDNQAMWLRELQSYPLGPKLAQCCGGMVRLLFERFGHREISQLKSCDIQQKDVSPAPCGGLLVRQVTTRTPVCHCDHRQSAHTFPLPVAGVISQMLSGQRQIEPALIGKPDHRQTYFIEPVSRLQFPLFVYGAGHVGRAIVKIAADLPFQIHWVDTHAHRFPETLPDNVVRVVAREPSLIAKSSPANAFHLVLTHSHALDFDICHELLSRHDFRFAGLIGSATKRARFMKRLSESGISQDALSRLTCPIGIAALKGKAPTTIAVSVAAQLIEQTEQFRAEEMLIKGGAGEPSEQVPA